MMNIEIFDGNLSKQDVKHNKIQVGCRGLVVKNDEVLVVYEEKWDVTTLPGGGLEPGETLEACVIREMMEETGVVVTNPTLGVTITEYFSGQTFVSHYFLCEYVETTSNVSYTNEELAVNLQAKWMKIDDLMTELSTNPTKYEYGVNIHNREFLAVINCL